VKVRILDATERVEYPAVNRRVVYLDVYYETVPDGFRGHVTLEKEKATPETIRAAIKADAARVNPGIGSTLEL
jgi:hypothetical protein